MLNWNRFFEKNNHRLLLLCIIIFLIFSAFHLNDYFRNDEYDFVNAGSAVAETGRPVYYQGELHPEFNGTWHPPLFVSLMGLTFHSAGEGEAQARSLTVFFAAFTIIIVYLLTIELFRDKDNRYTMAVIASFIFALNPLTIQSGLLIDIDTSILMFAMTAYLLLFIRWRNALSIQRIVMLGLVFALLMWIKFGTPPAILLGIVIFFGLQKQFKKAFGIPIIIGLIGMAVFLATWWLVASAKQLPFDMPFTHNSGTLTNFGFQRTDPGYIGFVIGGRLKLIVFWLTPFFMYFAQAALRDRWRKFRKSKQLENVDLVLIVAMIIFIQYTLLFGIAYYFPKYYAPMIPFTAVLVAYIICNKNFFRFDDDLENAEKNKPKRERPTVKGESASCEPDPEKGRRILYTYLLGFIIIFAVLALLLGDPNLSRDKLDESFTTFAAYIAAFFIAFVIIIVLFKNFCKCRTSLANLFFISVVLGLAASNLYIDVIQAGANYSVRYNYGEEGLEEVADYLVDNTDADSVIIAPKDIGYYVDVKFYEAFGGWMEDWTEFNNTIQQRNITHIVLRRNDAYSLDELPDEIINNIKIYFDEIKNERFEDFVVFERK